MDLNTEKLDSIIKKNGGESSRILAIYQDIQKEYRYLPKEAVKYVCGALEISEEKGYEVATFYKALSLTPMGKHTICVCLGTACHLKGGPAVLEAFERQLGVKRGETTKDGEFTLESVNCLGACALSPLVRIDEIDYGKSNPTKVKKILKDFNRGE
jgi:NADH-quinone oxidoreductase subunit E